MAAVEHSLSRRAVLGTAVALPLARTAAPLDATARATSWVRALTAYRAAEAEMRAFEGSTAGAPVGGAAGDWGGVRRTPGRPSRCTPAPNASARSRPASAGDEDHHRRRSRGGDAQQR